MIPRSLFHLGTAVCAILIGTYAMAEEVPANGSGPLQVPSGQSVTFADTVQDQAGPAGLTIRFRFIAPAIARVGGTIDFETAAADMQYLCDTFALPRIAITGPQPAQIVVSFSDRPVAFGQPTPEATQFIEAYAPKDGVCILEPF